MSEENNYDKSISSVAISGNKDWSLQRIVHAISISETSSPITLNVSGFLISGTLIGGKEYFESLGDEMSHGVSEGAENVKSFYSEPASLYTSDTYKEKPNIGYIHLKDAKFFHPSGAPIPSNRGVLWRGRIEEVSGFFLGSLSSPDPDDDE